MTETRLSHFCGVFGVLMKSEMIVHQCPDGRNRRCRGGVQTNIVRREDLHRDIPHFFPSPRCRPRSLTRSMPPPRGTIDRVSLPILPFPDDTSTLFSFPGAYLSSSRYPEALILQYRYSRLLNKILVRISLIANDACLTTA